MRILSIIAVIFSLILFSCGESKPAAAAPKPAVKIPKNRKVDPNIFPLLSDVYAGGANLDIDAKIYVWNGCQLATISKDGAEGREMMRVTVMKAAEWFGWGIHVFPEGQADMSAFQNGALHFFLKATNGTQPMKVGIKSGFATESWISMNDGSYGFQADNQWHEVEIPFSDFVPSVRMNAVTIYFMMSQTRTPPAPGSVYFLDGISFVKSTVQKALSGAVQDAAKTNQ